MTIDSLVERYLTLGLRIGRHVPDFVDAYYGPAELESEVDAAPPPPAETLVEESGRLLADVRAASDLEQQRRRWLEAQLTALETVARKLAGEQIGYADEIERCYGVRPARVPESGFELAHEPLDRVLPGGEPLADRWAAYVERAVVPGRALPAVLPALAGELRSRTQALVGLPDGESVEFDFVTDEPWTAFNYYLGARRSRIAVNTDLPVQASFVAELVAHEAYPGHHTEHASKEAALADTLGFGEERLIMTPAPQSVVSEGIAEVAVDVVLGDEAEAVAAEHLRRAGVEYDPQLGTAVNAAREALSRVAANAAWLLHEEGVPLDEVRAYVERWSLQPPKRVEHTLRFITDPTWRAYVFSYVEGRELVTGFVAGDGGRFRRLLTEQLTPADLAAR